uniref:MYM-type domain-containing protein n=1 Tax=viral metagenome TaxID=1070528 RepID=A0A6C0IBE5_9ZZZZ
MTKSKKRPVILKSTIDQEDQTLPIANIPSNSSGLCSNKATFRVSSEEAQSPLPESVVDVFSAPSQISTETTNINMLVCEKKPRKSTKKTKMDKVTVITDLTLPAYVPTLSPSELVVEGFQPSNQSGTTTQTLPVCVPIKLPSELAVLGDIRSQCEGILPSDQLPNSAPNSSGDKVASRVSSEEAESPLPKNQTTKKPPASKKTKRGKLNNTVSDNKRNENLPTIQIANIILHLKCSANDLEIYNEEVNRQLTDPLLYNPSVPPDIMTYQPAEQYSVLEETKPSNNTPENYAYSESKNRIAVQGSNKFSEIEIEVPNETTPKTDENMESTGLNMKEINTKLKKLKISLFKNMSFMDKKSACFWCTYDFDNPECYIPRYEMDGTVHGYGSFCRPECAAAYLMKENLDDSTKFERYHMLNQIYGKIYGYKKNIKPSPNPYYLLDKFYGNLTIQEYRKLLKSDHLLLVIDKPLTRILPELHEDNEEFLTSIYGNNTTITGGTNTQSIGATSAKSNTFGVYKVRRQSEKPVGVTKTSIIKEHFGITT